MKIYAKVLALCLLAVLLLSSCGGGPAPTPDQAEYTSARIKSYTLHDFTYGRVEARIKIPYGQGIWPAFWMLGSNFQSSTWPTCGEIDIMENVGKQPYTIHGTVHGPGYSGGSGIGASFSLPGNPRFADDYHIFVIEWEPSVIRWYCDGTLYQTLTKGAGSLAGKTWVFDHNFFIILNVAVGGLWPGYPDSTTVFPQMMYVDYVRVYNRTGEGTFETLNWNDEFNDPDGSAVNPANWNFDIGDHGWGNSELQNYTNSIENAYIEDGKLVIKAIKN